MDEKRCLTRKYKSENHININDILKKNLVGSFNESIKYSNSNSNNFAGRETNDISDWEDFSLEENEAPAELIDIPHSSDDKVETSNLKYRGKILDDSGSGGENFEIMVSDDEDKLITDENLSNKCKYDFCKDGLELHINFDDNQNTCRCIYMKMKQYLLLGIHEFWNITLAIFAMVVMALSLPFKLLRFLFYQMTKYLSFLKFILIPITFVTRLFLKKKDNEKLQTENCILNTNENCALGINSNNNASDESCERTHKPSFCFYVFCTAMVIGFFVIHCGVNPESKVCTLDSIVNSIQLMTWNIFNEIYILPGENCMKAGRCCKGFFEANFRWLNCLITLPIRSILTAWPRQPAEKDIVFKNINDIKSRVNKMLGELTEAKGRANKQEELLMKMRNQISDLEKVIIEKSEDIIRLETQLKYLISEVQRLRQNITLGMNEMANIISLKDNHDELIESMKNIAKDASNSIKSLISKVQKSDEVEQNRLFSRIESLESLLIDNQNKDTDSTFQILNKIQQDLDFLKKSQDEIKSKINLLKKFPEKSKTISETLKTEIKKLLDDQLSDHDKMTKRTECLCNKQLKNLKDDLDKSKPEFMCFIRNVVDDEADKIQVHLQKEISETFYEKTNELTKSIADDALNKYANSRKSPQMIKSSGFLADFLKIQPVPYTCQSDSTEKLLNYSAFCANKKIINDLLNEDNECLSETKIKQMVKMAMAKYSADKIGLADFALESMGGSVITSRSSPTYIGQYGFLSFLLNPLGRTYSSIRTIVQPGNQEGDCWSFAGSVGHAVIQLSHKIIVNAVSLEHLPARLHADGKISSAPKTFQIYSLLENTQEKSELIGTFNYSENGPAIQTFLVTTPKIARMIQFDVLSNHGNIEFTCVHRLRVHGVLHDAVDPPGAP